MENKIIESGAEFSECGKFRYKLWRIWDTSLPLVMFVGLNPSTANKIDNDPTIRSVIRISKNNGYGGVYMMNCFPFISTNPDDLLDFTNSNENERHLKEVAGKSKDIVFAWGNFSIIKKFGIDTILKLWFPNALAIHINKNGSPKHPLYCKSDTKFIPFK